jgi:hypothetical protein
VDGEGTAMASNVRYKVKGDNLLLRSVLHKVWGYTCYWCNWVKDFNDIQIDHIIPRTAEGERLQQLKTQFGLPADFDIHDPRNLAPICPSCNGPRHKGGQDLSKVPVVLDKLRTAMALRSKVIEEVQTFANPSKTAEGLILANDADLSKPATRQAFETYAPAVVQKLALLDEAKADFVSFRTVEVQVDENHDPPDLKVGISLRARERRAAAILEDVCGGVIEDVIQEPVIDLFQQIHEKVQQEFESPKHNPKQIDHPIEPIATGSPVDDFLWIDEEIDHPTEPIDVGPPVSDFIRINVNSLDFNRIHSFFFEFTFSGEFEASLSASLAQYRSDGSELVELQGDAFVTGRYSFVATWNISKGGQIETGDCSIESWDCGTSTSAWH